MSFDALATEIDGRFLAEKLKGKKVVIKKFLLDQHQIRGIGNAYADEILWVARLSPFSIAGKIPTEVLTHLAKAIKEVLTDAEKEIKKSHPDLISGEVRDFLRIHNPKKSKSPKGKEILIGEVGSRKTYYTEEQVLYK